MIAVVYGHRANVASSPAMRYDFEEHSVSPEYESLERSESGTRFVVLPDGLG